MVIPVNPRAEVTRFMQARDWPNALAALDRVLRIDSAQAQFLIYKAQCLLMLGQRRTACEAAASAERCAADDPVLWDAIGGIFSLAQAQQRALQAYDRAVALAPNHAHFRFNRAAVRRFLGQFAAAEADYDRVIELRPDDFEAYKNRSDLRAQTTANNHVRSLERVLARGIPDWRGEVQIRHSLAKEYEDLGEYGKSFANLRAGANKRREHLKYDVATDVETVQWITQAFPGAPQSREPRGDAGYTGDAARDAGHTGDAAPIFIVGLPRSGTTLVDRILSSHSELESAGELSDFALALVAAVRSANGGKPLPRRELVARSAHLDFAALGKRYLEQARAVIAAGRFTDKMPLNYLYCGLIRRSLPHARIVHLTRHPMAACYAMYKTLFKDAYPFSYDLGEIAQYYIAYRRLMEHWLTTLPGSIHTVAYEDLVADQVAETRKLLAFCGLDWQEACTQFHENPAATTTASASQVRRPIYTSSVAQWRHYETELAPLSDALKSAGIAL